MDLTVRLPQGDLVEAWWLVLMHGGGLAGLLLACPDNALGGLLAVLICLDGWRTAARYALRREADSVVAVHVKGDRIAGVWLKDARYVSATGRARFLTFGVVDVLVVPGARDGAAGRSYMIVDGRCGVDEHDRHLLRFAARDVR